MSRRKRIRGPSLTDSLGIDRGDELELSLGPLDEQGETTAQHDGVLVHVAGGITGERVRVEITRLYREELAATVTEVLDASPDRVDAPCPYYMECSGCQWQHVAYETQLEYKRARVESALRAHTVLDAAEVLPTLPSPAAYGYRNHARFTIDRDGEVGFVNRHTRSFLKVDECLLMAPEINRPLAEMQGRLPNMTQMSVRVGVNTGDLLIQSKLSNPEVDLPSGGRHYFEELCGRRFKVDGSSFFQVNTRQTEALAGILLERLHLSGSETVVDAYAGVGTYAVLLARSARRVVAIEESKSAVADAQENAAGLENVEFIQARTEDALGEIGQPVDAVVLDPPRVGCHPAALDAVRSLAPGRVAMVSCDPGTMARDLGALCGDGSFILEPVQPIDMFPQTHHVECIVTLRKATR